MTALPDPSARRPIRSIFVLRLEAKPGEAGIHAVRALLKTLLRRYGIRCVGCVEELREDTGR
jgi:hypothetical protein